MMSRNVAEYIIKYTGAGVQSAGEIGAISRRLILTSAAVKLGLREIDV